MAEFIKNIIKARFLREAGHVQRCHNLPHHGEYTVGKHSYDALSLLFVLYPGDPSINLIKSVLWHDSAERYLGDVPAPAKWTNPDLKEIYETIENETLKRHGCAFELTENEHLWLKAIDMVEFWLWCLDQQMLGNTMIDNAKDAIEHAIKTTTTPMEVYRFFANFNPTRGKEYQ